jgi:3-hydroxyisobutyrate dehydrogenase-like beta-hydroxyacid dehydrogenase
VREAEHKVDGEGLRVGFVGLGHMGVPMAARLVAAGHEVRGFDVEPAARVRAGAVAVGSLGEAAAGAEVIVMMLATSAIVRQVVLDEGLLDAVEPGAVVLATSTRPYPVVSSGPRRAR